MRNEDGEEVVYLILFFPKGPPKDGIIEGEDLLYLQATLDDNSYFEFFLL